MTTFKELQEFCKEKDKVVEFQIKPKNRGFSFVLKPKNKIEVENTTENKRALNRFNLSDTGLDII